MDFQKRWDPCYFHRGQALSVLGCPKQLLTDFQHLSALISAANAALPTTSQPRSLNHLGGGRNFAASPLPCTDCSVTTKTDTSERQPYRVESTIQLKFLLAYRLHCLARMLNPGTFLWSHTALQWAQYCFTLSFFSLWAWYKMTFTVSYSIIGHRLVLRRSPHWFSEVNCEVWALAWPKPLYTLVTVTKTWLNSKRSSQTQGWTVTKEKLLTVPKQTFHCVLCFIKELSPFIAIKFVLETFLPVYVRCVDMWVDTHTHTLTTEHSYS